MSSPELYMIHSKAAREMKHHRNTRVLFHIAADTVNIDIALSYLDKMEKAINRLQTFPESGSIPRYSILKKP